MTVLRVARWLALAAMLGLLLTGAGYFNATRDPVAREASIAMPAWPARAPPMRVVLLSDIHVAGPDMPPARLARIVERINRHRPDLVLIAGDLVSDKRVATRAYPLAEAIAPLAGLRARHGVVAVLGNHDHWRGTQEARRALAAAGITVLRNSAVRRGPLTVAGAGDIHTGRADVERLARSARELPGPVAVLSHSPDVVPRLDDSFTLVLAGHTHCGQIAPPLLGRPVTMSRYGERYACGVIREGGRTIVVGAGLGTSLLPLRFGAPPDFWILTLGPARRGA